MCGINCSTINLPVGDAVRTACHSEMGDTATVFYSDEQQRFPAGKLRGTGIKDAVSWIWPVVDREKGIVFVTVEYFAEVIALQSLPPTLGL